LTTHSPIARPIEVAPRPGGVFAARFLAMGCPCEVLVAGADEALAARHAMPAAEEAWRIEAKFSRYREDSVVAAIHASAGRAVAIDGETARLIEYAAQCFDLSGGLFDITSGVLRRAWKFDGSDRVPTPAQVEPLLALIGFPRLLRSAGAIAVPEGMQVDLGGLAKEYAVDRALALLDEARPDLPVLVNFGGDLRANRPPSHGPWQVGVEDARSLPEPWMVVELTKGALATSGDAHRFLLKDGVRYGHVLDPRTGWPVAGAPRSVTVAAGTCIEAGTLSTIALLRGAGAEEFLAGFSARSWCLR